jgi:hypothetical protein
VRLRDEYLERARRALGPERLAMEWRAGRALAFEQALVAAQESLAPESLAVTRIVSPGVSGSAE